MSSIVISYFDEDKKIFSSALSITFSFQLFGSSLVSIATATGVKSESKVVSDSTYSEDKGSWRGTAET